jgi:hypothetical protein
MPGSFSPCSDPRHIPTRVEIDLELGQMVLAELKRLEERIEDLVANVDWQMHWYAQEGQWGYRASYKSRVLCVLHFYDDSFTVTVAIPPDSEAAYRGIKELPVSFVHQFAHFRSSKNAKWFTFRIRKKTEVDGITEILRMKIGEMRVAAG